MTEKRFTQKDEDDWEILDRGKHFAYAHSGYQAEKIIDELNELVDTNRELYKENEQLKQENKKLQGEYDKQAWEYNGLGCEYDWLKEENEQLKSTIKEVTELLSDEVDLFSDKATEHDINAYMELKELDNKDAFYMATATKKAIQMLKELKE